MNDDNNSVQAVFKRSLNRLLDRHGVPASQYGRLESFAALVERPKTTVHRWVKNGVIPDIATLLQICDCLSCSLDELFERAPHNTATGNERFFESSPPLPPEVYQKFRVKRDFEQHPLKRMIYFSDNGNVEVDLPAAFFTFADPLKPIGLFRVTGDEMIGFCSPNDRVFFDMDATEIASSAVYVLRVAGRLTIRRLRVRLDKNVDVLCENPNYPPEMLSPSAFKRFSTHLAKRELCILGRIVARLNIEQFSVSSIPA